MPGEDVQTRRSHTHVARLHTRGPSHNKGLHRVSSKVHAGDALHAKSKPPGRATSPQSPGDAAMKRTTSERNLPRNPSTSSLKKNNSHVVLRRNRSSAEVKRPRPTSHLKRSSSEKHINTSKQPKSSVHFDLGTDPDLDGQEDGWTEASNSASPSVSRSGSVAASSGRNSAKRPSSNANSQSQSPEQASKPKPGNWTSDQYVTPDAKQITSRLLQRTPTHNAPPKMSSVSATATPGNRSPDTYEKINGTPVSGMGSNGREQVVSRFVGSTSGTPRDDFTTYASQIQTNTAAHRALEAPSRAASMRNLGQDERSDDESDEERVLAPKARRSKRNGSAYNPPQQSRTQQKLWLQRASSNVEPRQLPHAPGINGLGGGMLGPNPMVNPAYDGRLPLVRTQLERTGLEYLVVRRFQDPVGRALQRLSKMPGMEKRLRIPEQPKRNSGTAGAGRYGLSQSMRETRPRREPLPRSSFEDRSSSQTDHASGARDDGDAEDNGVSAILRSIWEKSLDLSPSA